jgi:hypothetical protein
LLPDGLTVPQTAQAVSSRAPHSPQNFAPAALSRWHREHSIQVVSRPVSA